MSHPIDRSRADPPPSPRRPAVDVAIEAIACAGAPLAAFTDFSGTLGRSRFLAAALLAAVGIVAARAMDWLVFVEAPGRVPAFFVTVAGVALAIVLPAVLVRRLRDAGATWRSLLLALVPVIGWIILARRLLGPTRPVR